MSINEQYELKLWVDRRQVGRDEAVVGRDGAVGKWEWWEEGGVGRGGRWEESGGWQRGGDGGKRGRVVVGNDGQRRWW